MNAWLLAALVLALGFVPCALVLWRASVPDALVGLNMAGVLATLELVLLAEGFNRAPFYDLAFILALFSLAGGLVVARFLEHWV